MGKSLILAVDELAQGQTQAFQTVNDMLAALEDVTNRPKTVDLSALDDPAAYAMAELDLVRYIAYLFTGATEACTVTFPATVNTNESNRVLWVLNDSEFDLTFQGAGGSTTAVVHPGATACLLIIGNAVRDLVGSKGLPHSVAYFTAGIPTTGNEVLRYAFSEAVAWDADMVGSQGSVAVTPGKYTFFYVYKNGSKIGDIMVDSTGDFTFKTDGGAAVSWEVGDVLTVIYYPLEVGLITFSAVADSGDTVTINGTLFTFGGAGGQVAPGADATASATNLKAAIEGSALASTVRVLINGSALTLINLTTSGGGSLSKSDADNDFALTAFATETSASTFGVTFLGSRA